MQKAKQDFSERVPLLLENAVRKSIDKKSKEIYYATQYKYDPQKRKIGEYETRIARYPDTTFTYRKKIVDAATDAFNGIQTLLLEIEQLHADSIQILFNEELQANNIHVQSIVGITASFYKQLNDWSADTTAININYRTAFTGQGDFEDINYYAYIHYSFASLWQFMPKNSIYALFTCTIISVIILAWWLYKCKKEKKNTIVRLKNGNYCIKDVLYHVKDKQLIKDGKKFKLTEQLHELFILFLNASQYQIEKKDIKHKFWPKNMDSTSNMTSAVNRLNARLKDVNCIYTIITDPKNDDYYILSPLF